MLFSRVEISMDMFTLESSPGLHWCLYNKVCYTVSFYCDSLTITEVVIITQRSKAKSCKTRYCQRLFRK